MRFDLLDEYSSLVPSRRSVSRNAASKDPAVPAKGDKRGALASLANHLGALRKFLGVRRQMALSGYRNLAAK